MTATECGGCRKAFDLAGETICIKCRLLSRHRRDSETYRQIMDWPQCVGCSDAFANMCLPTNGIQTCGSQTCESTSARASMQAAPMSTDKADEPPTHRRINALSDTNSQRSVVLHERLKLSRPPPTAGTSVTSAEIHEREDAMRQEVRDLQSSIKIQVEFAVCILPLSLQILLTNGHPTLILVTAVPPHQQDQAAGRLFGLGEDWLRRRKDSGWYVS
ncbi:hypothetical protein BKA70DRAFT_1230005 [Coprinopsis sp. MPI-PUGE-AT-0042]|nr:hypothetical protein BKA70DRAFT_1230005 [Coprinopsis sp. MPI-PUGE-AT-0042]